MIASLSIFAAAAMALAAWNAASPRRAPAMAYARCSVSSAQSRYDGEIAAAANGI